MYYTFLEKQLARKKPFHQKVLHFQYDVPLSQLRKIFDFWRGEINHPLMMATDCSDTGRNLPVKDKAILDESFWRPEHIERKAVGIFDETEAFYLRIEIDSIESAHEADEICGNFFLFADEGQLLKVANEFKAGCGQLIIEGTADYLVLLED